MTKALTRDSEKHNTIVSHLNTSEMRMCDVMDGALEAMKYSASVLAGTLPRCWMLRCGHPEICSLLDLLKNQQLLGECLTQQE